MYMGNKIKYNHASWAHVLLQYYTYTSSVISVKRALQNDQSRYGSRVLKRGGTIRFVIIGVHVDASWSHLHSQVCKAHMHTKQPPLRRSEGMCMPP